MSIVSVLIGKPLYYMALILFNTYFASKVVSVFVASEGNYFGDLFKCNDFLLKCQETEIIMGKFNRMTNELNRNCSKEIGSKWSNITRCEFEATKCLCKNPCK